MTIAHPRYAGGPCSRPLASSRPCLRPAAGDRRTCLVGTLCEARRPSYHPEGDHMGRPYGPSRGRLPCAFALALVRDRTSQRATTRVARTFVLDRLLMNPRALRPGDSVRPPSRATRRPAYSLGPHRTEGPPMAAPCST